MDAGEFQQLWTLLRNLFPASARLKSENAKKVWARAMEPYELTGVSDAAVVWSRKSKFLPDISDLTVGLSQEQSGSESPEPSPFRPPEMAEHIQKAAALASEIRAGYHAAGTLSPPEAKRRGIPYAAWSKAAKEAGA